MSLEALKIKHPFPEHKPDVPPCPHGWLFGVVKKSLQAIIGKETRCVLEVGSWMGLSTRFILDAAPHATVICVDTWAGSPEHFARPAWAAMVPTLYETFIVNLWPYRDRVIPMRMPSTEGIAAIAAAGVVPECVYIDALHDYDSVRADTEAALAAWPNAPIVGDDYSPEWPGIIRWVDELIAHPNRRVRKLGRAWTVRRA